MNFRSLNIREAHERLEAMEEASVMMVGLNPERIMQGIVQLQYQQTGEERNFKPVGDNSMPNVSEKVVKIILSYTDYIKRTIWSEEWFSQTCAELAEASTQKKSAPICEKIKPSA
jgi:UDP-N-acetyl-L-fucosamine synthase